MKSRRDKRQLNGLYSSNAEFAIKDFLIANPQALNTVQNVWVRVDDDVDIYLKETTSLGEPLIRIDEKEAQWIKSLVEAGQIDKRFNIQFFTSSDSREPELAGVRGALTGTMLTMLVTLVLSFPLGVAAALPGASSLQPP